jgi:hypothetical protein
LGTLQTPKKSSRANRKLLSMASTLKTNNASGSGAPAACPRFHCWEGLVVNDANMACR